MLDAVRHGRSKYLCDSACCRVFAHILDRGPDPNGPGGNVKETSTSAVLEARIQGRPVSTHALVIDEIGRDEEGRPIEILFGALAMQQWGISHEEYASFIEALVWLLAEELDLIVEGRGRATWKRRSLRKGAEPDTCFYVANAPRIIGRRQIDLDRDPPPDIVVEIDITNESLSKFSIYSTLVVPEIWRYDGTEVRFYELAGDAYREVPDSRMLAGLRPAMLAEALEESKTEGQTAALRAFRQRWRASR